MQSALPQEKTNSRNTHRVKKYGLTMLVSSDDQVKAYIKKIMTQLNEWMIGGKISKLVVVITSKDTGEHLERWQFDVPPPLYLPSLQIIISSLCRSKYSQNPPPRNPPSAPSTKRTTSQNPAATHRPQPRRRKPRSRRRSNLSSGRSRRR
jgi:hypothetical protein